MILGKLADELCDNGSITLDTIESWGNEHLRTSGK